MEKAVLFERFVIPKCIEDHRIFWVITFTKCAWHRDILVYDPLACTPNNTIQSRIWIDLQIMEEVVSSTNRQLLNILLIHKLIVDGNILHDIIDPVVL